MVLVIGAGYGTTATSSFREAMRILGFGKCYHMTDVTSLGHADKWIEISDRKDPKLIRDLLDKGGYQSACEMPSSVYWKETMKAYPDAVVILNMRDPEKWYKTWMETVAFTQPDFDECPFGVRVAEGVGLHLPPMPSLKNFAAMSFRTITMDAFHGDLSKKNMIREYNRHVEEVRSSCPPKKLLEFSYSDGWEPLCKFLNVPIPNVPIPNLNDTAVIRKRVFAMNIIGWIIFILGFGIPGLYCARSKISEKEKRSSNTA